QRAHALVELAAGLADLLRRLRDAMLAPRLRRAPEQRDQVDRARQQHALLHPAVDQTRVDLKGGTEEVLPGQEHDDELRGRLELLPVGLAGELSHVLAHEAGVLFEQAAALPVARRLGVEVGPHAGLGLAPDVAAAGETAARVGPRRAVTPRRGPLLVEVAVLAHARELDAPPQLHLPPAAANTRRAQRER